MKSPIPVKYAIDALIYISIVEIVENSAFDMFLCTENA